MKIRLNESQLKKVITKVIKEVLKESNEEFQNIALDNMNKLGGFDKLSDLDKLALLGGSGNYDALKKLSLTKIFKDMGGTFGDKLIKVKILPVNEQPVKHKFSIENADEEGFLSGYPDYDNNPPYEAFVTVTFKKFTYDESMKGGGAYKSLPIMLRNVFPIDYDHTDHDFVRYARKVEQDRQDFLRGFGVDDDEDLLR